MNLKELLKQREIYKQTLKMIENRRIKLMHSIEEIDSKIKELTESDEE